MSDRSPSPMRLLLIRHGQDIDNSMSIINGRRDTPLTNLGRQQAKALAAGLGRETMHCIYTSPLRRARETAAIISEELSIPDLRVEPELIEREYGILTGCSPADIPRLATRVMESQGFKHVIECEGAETYAELWTRARMVLQKLRGAHPGQTIMLVAHHEILRMIRANAVHRTWEEELAFPVIPNCQVVALNL